MPQCCRTNTAFISVPAFSSKNTFALGSDSLQMHCWFCASLSIFSFDISNNTNRVAILGLCLSESWSDHYELSPWLHHNHLLLTYLTYFFCVLSLMLIRYIIQDGKGQMPIKPSTNPLIITLFCNVYAYVGWVPSNQEAGTIKIRS